MDRTVFNLDTAAAPQPNALLREAADELTKPSALSEMRKGIIGAPFISFPKDQPVPQEHQGRHPVKDNFTIDDADHEKKATTNKATTKSNRD